MSRAFVLLYVFYDMKDPEVLGIYLRKEAALQAFEERLRRKVKKIPSWMSPAEAEERAASSKDIPELSATLAEKGLVYSKGERCYLLLQKEITP